MNQDSGIRVIKFMDDSSSSNNSLTELLEEVMEWCSKYHFPDGIQMSFSLRQLRTVKAYLSQVEVNHEMFQKLCLSRAWRRRSEPEMYKEVGHIIMRFMEDLRELFKVPKLQLMSLNACTLKNELVASFFSFLIELLLDNPGFFSLRAHPDVKNPVVKELIYLVTILADEPFGDAEQEQVQSILAGFESLANEAGDVVHSLVFRPVVEAEKRTPVEEAIKTDDKIGVLYRHILHFKTEITQFLDLIPHIICCPARKIGFESFYIVGSLMCDLEDLMNLNVNGTLVEVEDQITALHKLLKLCHSLFNLPQCIDNKELMKEPMIQVIVAAKYAEYLINSFVVGDLPLWYLTIRLTHHINKIELNATRIQEMNQDSSTGVTKVMHEFGVKLSLQDKVVVTAGILSSKEEEESIWENVGQHVDHSMLFNNTSLTMRILERSYKHLPHYLKPCLLYLGSYKEDEKIVVKDVIRHWIALGFICKKGECDAELVGREYLMELIDRSLVNIVERRSNGGAKSCSIHYLLHEMCWKIQAEENFQKVIHSDGIAWDQRYLRLWGVNNEIGKRIWDSCSIFCNIDVLRILQVYVDFQYDGEGIESLVHLRYLDVKKLPSSWHRNVNLEFVCASDMFYITSRTMQMPKLKSIKGSEGILMRNFDMSSRTSKLECLVNVHICSLEDLEKLKCMPNLRKLKLRVVAKSMECLDLQFLTQLESLSVLGWFEGGDIKYPSSITRVTLANMPTSWTKLSELGTLSSLQVLKLQGIGPAEGERWETRDGEFKQLRVLKLEGLLFYQWSVSSNQHFPKLQKLLLKDCEVLKEIPDEIGEIGTLQLIEVRGQCQDSLVKSAVKIREEQHNMRNQSLRVDTQDAEIIQDNRPDSLTSSLWDDEPQGIRYRDSNTAVE